MSCTRCIKWNIWNSWIIFLFGVSPYLWVHLLPVSQFSGEAGWKRRTAVRRKRWKLCPCPSLAPANQCRLCPILFSLTALTWSGSQLNALTAQHIFCQPRQRGGTSFVSHPWMSIVNAGESGSLISRGHALCLELCRSWLGVLDVTCMFNFSFRVKIQCLPGFWVLSNLVVFGGNISVREHDWSCHMPEQPQWIMAGKFWWLIGGVKAWTRMLVPCCQWISSGQQLEWGALSFSNTLIHISFTGAIFGEDETEFIVLYVFRSRFLKRWFCI